MGTTESARAYLERERERLLEQIRQQGIMGEEHAGYGNHMADDATEVFEQTKSLALRRNLERMLEQVEDALHRFEEGTYGICEACGAQIDPARLRALPYATLCIECQQHRERR
ncbi:MAG TPA: conjugal transfer protein TraR [Anaerolineae bacterium]|nr:conjugal transfer protein TraR [Anaerolineae bacterium]